MWIFRDFRAVVNSMVVKWADTFFEEGWRVESDPEGFWSLEDLPRKIEGMLCELSLKGTTRNRYALFWYFQNQIFFEQNLESDSRVYGCDYRDISLNPVGELEKIYSFLELDLPGPGIARIVTQGSVAKGSKIQISPPVAALCDKMMARLSGIKGRRATED